MTNVEKERDIIQFVEESLLAGSSLEDTLNAVLVYNDVVRPSPMPEERVREIFDSVRQRYASEDSVILEGQSASNSFLKTIFSQTQGFIEVRALQPRLDISRIQKFFESPDNVEPFAKEHREYNCYFGVCTRQTDKCGRKENCLEVPCLWAEIDYKDISKDEVFKRIQGFPVKPTFIVESGNGIHVYWLLKKPEKANPNEVEPYLRALANHFNGDLSAAELARILRIPGTLNFKYDPPREVKLIESNGNRYNLTDFDDFKNLDTDRTSPKGSNRQPSESIQRIMKCEFMRHCERDRAKLSEPEWYIMITELAREQGGPAKIHELSQGYPRYSRSETDQKILHALDDTRPITCAKIKEIFRCGRTCDVRAPAALAHKDAPSLEERLKRSSTSLQDVHQMVKKNAKYETVVESIAQIPLEAEKEKAIAELANREKVTKEAVRKDVQRRLNSTSQKARTETQDTRNLSEEEEKAALALLEDDNFLDGFLNTTECLGCVGEENNKVTLYLSLTSRIQDDPINIIVKGESSAGKSYLVESVSQFFPGEEIRQFTALTPKALFHRKDDLKHKAFIVYERSGAEESDYSIRTLQSEKKLIFSTPVKNPETNAFETEDIEIEGPIAYVETTTKTHIHPENETRCFEIFTDESEEQTKRIYEAQNRKHEIMALDKEAILKPWKNAQRLLKSYPVLIPYIDLIEFPTKPLRVRRDRPKFLALIEASALLRQHQREKRTINGKEFIVADIEDYTVAYSLIDNVLESVLKGQSPKVKELIKAAKQFDGRQFTNKDLRDKVEWNEKTVIKHVKEAVSWGYFEITEEGGRGRAYHYKLVKTDDSPAGLLAPDKLKEEITKITTNNQLGGGDFNPLILHENQSNDQFHQQNIKDGRV